MKKSKDIYVKKSSEALHINKGLSRNRCQNETLLLSYKDTLTHFGSIFQILIRTVRLSS